MLYSHDTFGLGHLQRSLALAGELAQRLPRAHQLLMTGSMVAGAFSLPPRLDMIKLPTLSKRSNGSYKSRALPLTLRQTLLWREQKLLQAVTNFRPDLLLVDKVAAGVHGELLPTLRHLKTWSPETRLVLGMRDIEDSPEVTRQEWAAQGTRQLMAEVYDALLLYGERAVFDPLTAYDMEDVLAEKVVECGYIRRPAVGRSPARIRRELGLRADEPLVLVTVGGGGDGYQILATYLEMLATQPAAAGHSVLITGPLMPLHKRSRLARATDGLPVTLLAFTPELTGYMRAANLVVAMAGYNTVCEILSLSQRALLIPRTKVRKEQLLRAGALARRGLAHCLHPADLTPVHLNQAVRRALEAPRPAVNLNLSGLTRAGEALSVLLGQGTATRQRAKVKEIVV
jgi:predicted glycosyltransferase